MKYSLRLLALPALLFAAIFLPSAHAASFRSTGPFATPRFHHTATTLQNGRVLFAGGESGSGLLSTAEVFDPATSLGTATGSLSAPRSEHAAASLAGRVVGLPSGRSGVWRGSAHLPGRARSHAPL